MPIAFDSDRRWDFEESVDSLWWRISQVEDYTRWWPWLRRFDPGAGLVDGASWRCEVAPPLPYVVRFRLELVVVGPGEVHTSVRGDIRGEAHLVLRDHDQGCSARLHSRLAPAHPVLRGAGRVARPVVEWGHDWVLDQGLRQFLAHSGTTDETGA